MWQQPQIHGAGGNDQNTNDGGPHAAVTHYLFKGLRGVALEFRIILRLDDRDGSRPDTEACTMLYTPPPIAMWTQSRKTETTNKIQRRGWSAQPSNVGFRAEPGLAGVAF